MSEEFPSPLRQTLPIIRNRFRSQPQGFPDGVELRNVEKRLSMNQVTTFRWSFLEDLLAYRDAGVQNIGIWRPKLDEFGEQRAVHVIQEMDINVSSLSYAGCFTGQNGYAYTESLADARDAVKLAGKLNAECLVVLSGAQSGHILTHARRIFVSALKELGDLAESLGVRLAIQPMQRRFAHDWTFITSIDETMDVIDACNHKAVGMAFDVYHLWQEERLLDQIAEIAPLVATVQLNDWHRYPRSEYDRGLIGDGQIPLTDILQAFLQSGYAGAFEVAIWSEEIWKSNYEELIRECQTRFENLLTACPT